MNDILRDFMEFKRTFQGNPKEEVERLLQSGRVSQDMLNKAQVLAKQFQSLIK